MQTKLSKESIAWLTATFNVTAEEIIGHNSGNCYGKLWVKTEDAAKRAAETVKGEKVNGGMFHGMALGGIHSYGDHGETVWEVMV